MLKLVIQDDEGKTTVVPLVRDEITIGREEGNTIRLTERNVSRRHALLRRENGAVTLEDLKSYNGVRVNGNPVDSEVALNQSDRIQIGDYLIELREEDVERADSDQTTQRIEKLDSSELAAQGAGEERDDARTGPLPAAEAAEEAAPVSAGKAAAPSASPAPEALPTPTAVPVAPTAKPGTSATQPAEAAEPQAHGKLVVLSTNFAGREFVLDKASVVIGRTDDNDVCVDHRSISRHHAKVVREDGRYAIVDLQSSNGVRVNGEEYGKVELRRGDVVDLGHVRMRYVEPGEDFVFGRDAQPVDLEAGRRRGAVWAAVAVVLIGGGAGVFALASGGGEGSPADNTEEARAAATEDESDDESLSPASEGDATAESVEGPDQEDVDRVDEHLEVASEAVTDDRWEDVRDEAREALDIDPGNERALALVDQAESELENRDHYEDFQAALEAGDYREVAKTFSEIDRESVYRVKGQPEHDEMRDEYVERVERRARLAARRGQCGQLRRIAADARTIWPEAGEAASKVACRQRVADTSDTEEKAAPEEEDPPEDPPADDAGQSTSDTSSEPDEPSVEELVGDAQSAARTGEFGRALRLCEDALRRSRGHPEALMVCLISACNLQNVSKAKQYMSQISGDRRIYARQICLRHGVDLE